MKLGILNELCSFRYMHIESNLEFSPDAIENGLPRWDWQSIMDTGVDICVSIQKECLLSCAELGLTDDSGITRAEIWQDGILQEQYAAETGKTIHGLITIPLSIRSEGFILRLHGALQAVSVTSLNIYGACEDKKPFIWPEPKTISMGEGSVAVSRVTAVHSDNADETFAADFLSERMQARFESRAFRPEGVTVYIEEDASVPGETYRVSVSPEGIHVTAGSRLSLLYAADTLLQTGKYGEYPVCTVQDAPYKQMRGFHMGLPPREEIPFVKQFIRTFLVPLRYNQLFIEFAGGMRFDSHPEISEKWLEGNEKAARGELPPFPHGDMVAGGKLLEKSEVRDLLDYAHSFGLEIIPEVQSLSHVQYITYAHPELAEKAEEAVSVSDTRGEDARPDAVYHHCYCPSNPESYRIIFDLIDEIVEVARPQRYVHMGHDEVYQIGICPICKKSAPDKLYLKHVLAMREHLRKKGLGMMIWSDMLQPTEYPKYKTAPALAGMPKDIVFLDFIWYFHPELDLEDNLLPNGNPLVMGNLYSSHYTRYASRAAKRGVSGGEVSCWCRMSEHRLASLGKFWDLMMTSEMLWSDRYAHQLSGCYTMLLNDSVTSRMRDELHGAAQVRAGSVLLPFECVGSGRVPDAIAAVLPQAAVGEGARVPVNARHDRLVFVHTAQYPQPAFAWKKPKQIGAYTVHYADGTSALVPVEYNGNIFYRQDHFAMPKPQQYYRHTGYYGTWLCDSAFSGKAPDGTQVSAQSVVWDNPSPDKEIAFVDYHDIPDSGNHLIWVSLSARDRT